MNNEQIENALIQLGYTSGWAISDNKIILWEHDSLQPTNQELEEAANLWLETQAIAKEQAAVAKAALLAKLGITEEEAKLLLS